MSELSIQLNRKNYMDVLIKAYPNIIDDKLLKNGCYFLILQSGSIISYDCRKSQLAWGSRIRGWGYKFNKQLTHYKSKVATRHIQISDLWYNYNDVQILYNLNADELESFHSKISDYQKTFHKMIIDFPNIKGIESDNRYFCSPTLNVIVNVKPNGFELNPTWCKASAVYDAEEEFSFISPYHIWWYYPGRMYFSHTRWVEISKRDYQIVRKYLINAEEEIFKIIDNIIQ